MTKKKKITTATVLFVLVTVTLIAISWVMTEANYRDEDIRCRECHKQFNRLVNTGQIDLETYSPELVFGETYEETLAQYREQYPYMCEPCLESIAYAGSEGYPYDHPAWKGFVK